MKALDVTESGSIELPTLLQVSLIARVLFASWMAGMEAGKAGWQQGLVEGFVSSNMRFSLVKV